jgi:hypothetical protein
VGRVERGESVQFHFPIQEEEREVDIEKQRYHLTIKGHDVVDIYPRGTFCPFYQRDQHRDSVVRWKNVTRFISEEQIDW